MKIFVRCVHMLCSSSQISVPQSSLRHSGVGTSVDEALHTRKLSLSRSPCTRSMRYVSRRSLPSRSVFFESIIQSFVP